jgi:hypothetical protein
MQERILIAIDNTDSPDSRGTGFLARQLGELITMNSLGRVRSVSRHYLFPYLDDPVSSYNSAICMDVFSNDPDELVQFCVDFLKNEASPKSSPGLCMAPWEGISDKLIDWSREAKKGKVRMEDALRIGREENIFLKGWRGGDGRIGALAGLGLRRSGNDGRFTWLERLRKLSGAYSAEDLMALTAVDEIIDTNGEIINPEDLIEVGDWVRPVLINHSITIIVRKNTEEAPTPWIATSKEYVYSISR